TPYRSAGRPEAIFVIERLIDLAARELGMDRVELRRRNLIPESAMPHRNPFGLVYDSGAYSKTMARRRAPGAGTASPARRERQRGRHRLAVRAAVVHEAEGVADWSGFPARRDEARTRGRLRGIGIANYVEVTSGFPTERAEITVRP